MLAAHLRGNTIRGNMRGKWHSERVSERAFLRDPLRGRFPSQNLSGLLPLIVLPLNLSLGKATKFKRTRGFSKLTRFRNTKNLVNPLCLDMDVF